MRDFFRMRRPPEGFGLQLVLVISTVALMLGGIYVRSFVSHFVWMLTTKEAVHSAKDFPAWLAFPSVAIGFGLVFLIGRWLRLLEKFARAFRRR